MQTELIGEMMFRFLIIGIDFREVHDCDSFNYDGKSIALFKTNNKDSEIVQLESSTLIAAYWNIQGFKVEEFDDE